MKRLLAALLLAAGLSANAYAGGSTAPGIVQSGGVTAGHCYQIGATGVAIDAGAACGTGTSGVSQFNLRTGAVALTAADVGATITGTAATHQFFNTLSSAGVFGAAQPAIGDIQNIAASSFICNNTGAPGPLLACTQAQATALLNPFSTTLQGLAPASGGGTTNFLRADGTWAAPPGGGGTGTVTSVALTAPGGFTVTGSPVTNSGTLALTASGTSGGVLFYNSASTMASSGALTANNPVIGGGAGVAPSSGTRSGNTTVFGTTTGTLTSGDCAKFDASGNIVDCAGVALLSANNLSDLGTASTARTNLGLGTSATVNTGTSGATIPLLSAANTWTLGQTFSAAPTLGSITGSTQCLHVNTSGVISGTAADCGAGGGAVSLTAGNGGIVVSPNPITGTGTVSTSFPSQTKTAAYTVVSTDLPSFIWLNSSSPFTFTIPQATGSFANGAAFCVGDQGTGALTLSPTTSTIHGIPSLVLQQNQTACLMSDGTNWGAQGGQLLALLDNGSFLVASEGIDLQTNSLGTEVTNAGTTGTTLNKLAKLTGAPSTAVIAATTDTDNMLGIVIGGAGTAGKAQIAVSGQASCVFDGATTAGDYVQISATTAGDCHDAGSSRPLSTMTIGRVLSTNAAGGTFAVALTLGVTNTAGGGSGTVNSGTAGQLTWYAGTGTAVSGNANLTVSGGALTVGVTGSAAGSVVLSGGTSGTGTVSVAAAAGTGTVFQLPSANGASANLLINQGSNASAWQALSGDCTISAAGAITCTKTNGTSFGTASAQNSGTSGAVVPLLNGNNTWSKGQAVTPFALTDGATITPDATQSTSFTVTLGGNRTIANATGIIAGQTLIFYLTQDGTGSRTITWGTSYKFPGGTKPTLSSAAAATDMISCHAETTSFFSCVAALNMSWLDPANDNDVVIGRAA